MVRILPLARRVGRRILDGLPGACCWGRIVKPRVFKRDRFWRVEYEFRVSPILHIHWREALKHALEYA